MEQKSSQLEAETCVMCGTNMKTIHCTYLCPNCGFTTDCSDL